MSTDDPIPQKPSFGKRLLLAFKHFLLFIFRVTLILLILGAIGAAIYLGAPMIIDEYLLKDVKINSGHIQEISTQLETNVNLTEERLADLQDRLENLEIQGDTDKQSLADIQTQLITAETKLQEQVDMLQGYDSIQSTLTEYGTTLASLEKRITAYEADLEEVRNELAALPPVISENQEELEELLARFDAREPAIILRQDLALLKVMELITRAQVSMGNENIGLARDDINTAQDLLTNLSLDLPAHQAEYLANIAGRLETASENLIQAPNLVRQDLEVAWQLLLQGLPEGIASSDATPTPTSEP